jgi:putative oxidoreductase
LGKGHDFDLFGKGEHAALFLTIFLGLLFVGPGRISIDGMIKK